MAYSKRNPNIGGNPGNPVYGALGSGSTQSINPHGLQTYLLNFLANLNPPKVQQPKKASAFNFPGMYSDLKSTYGVYSRERLGRKNLRWSQEYSGQQISDAEEDLRKRKILYNENLASRGVGGQMREGKPAADWMFESRQRNINLAKVRRHEEKSRWKRQRLHRILFG